MPRFGIASIRLQMFQHTERHIKRRPTCCPELETVTSTPN